MEIRPIWDNLRSWMLRLGVGRWEGVVFFTCLGPPRTWVPRWGLERDHASAIWMHSVNKEEKLATLYKPIRPSLKLVITPHEPREISSSFPNITSINANSTEPTASRKFTATFQLGNLHRKSIFEGSEGIGNCNLIQSVRDEHFIIIFFLNNSYSPYKRSNQLDCDFHFGLIQIHLIFKWRPDKKDFEGGVRSEIGEMIIVKKK